MKTCILFFYFTGLIFLTFSCRDKPVSIIITTSEVTAINQTSAVSGGKISAGKGAEVIIRGVSYSTDENPALSESKTEDHGNLPDFVSSLSGLKPGTTYYARAYAITSNDTIFGNTISFSTLDFGVVSDVEGNVYNTVKIGTRTWMAVNLATTRFSDGSSIPLVNDERAWAGLSLPSYCWYKNEKELFIDGYGALYNWYAVNTGKLCPSGWHVPSDEEWTIMTNYLGGEEVSGGKLKEAGTVFWVNPNEGATNAVGFTALPGGFRYHDGKFYDFGFSGYWWSSTEYMPGVAWFRFLYYNESSIFRFNNKEKNGFSVRCIKNP